MVSTMSSMKRCISGRAISPAGTGSAALRSTGLPRRATFRMAMAESFSRSGCRARARPGDGATRRILARAALLDPADAPHALGQCLGVPVPEALELVGVQVVDRRLELGHRALELRV